jgi:hypothetical protein
MDGMPEISRFFRIVIQMYYADHDLRISMFAMLVKEHL